MIASRGIVFWNACSNEVEACLGCGLLLIESSMLECYSVLFEVCAQLSELMWLPSITVSAVQYKALVGFLLCVNNRAFVGPLHCSWRSWDNAQCACTRGDIVLRYSVFLSHQGCTSAVNFQIINSWGRFIWCVFKGNLFFPILTVVWCLLSEVEGSQPFLGCPSWKVWMETPITAAQVRMAHRSSALQDTSVVSCSTGGLTSYPNQGKQFSVHVGSQSCRSYPGYAGRMLTCAVC